MNKFVFETSFNKVVVNYQKGYIKVLGNNSILNEGVYSFLGLGLILTIAPLIFQKKEHDSPIIMLIIGIFCLIVGSGYLYNRLQKRMKWTISKKHRLIRSDGGSSYDFNKIRGLEISAHAVSYRHPRSTSVQTNYYLSLITDDGIVRFLPTTNYEITKAIASHFEKMFAWPILREKNFK